MIESMMTEDKPEGQWPSSEVYITPCGKNHIDKPKTPPTPSSLIVGAIYHLLVDQIIAMSHIL